MDVKQKIIDIINIVFHDELIDINPPIERWMEYRDIGRRLEAYVVRATYKYRGNIDYTFSIDNDHFMLVTPQRALQNANNFYLQALQQIKNRNENTK